MLFVWLHHINSGVFTGRKSLTAQVNVLYIRDYWGSWLDFNYFSHRLSLFPNTGLLQDMSDLRDPWVAETYRFPEAQAFNPHCRWASQSVLDPETLKFCGGAEIQLETVPPGLLPRIPEYFICTGCGKVFWEGTHFDRVLAQFQEVLHLSDWEVSSQPWAGPRRTAIKAIAQRISLQTIFLNNHTFALNHFSFNMIFYSTVQTTWASPPFLYFLLESPQKYYFMPVKLLYLYYTE